MRILLLSQWCEPEPEPRVLSLAKILAARGHTVSVITGVPNYPIGAFYPGYRFRPWPVREIHNGVRVIRVPLFPDRSKSALKRVLNYGSFAVSAAFWGGMLSGPVDAMWVYHPPLTVAFPAWVISAARRTPFVYEIQDMWPETLAATGMIHSKWILQLVAEAANLLYRSASHLVVISPGFKRNLVGKGVPSEKVEVVPNWADEDAYRPAQADATLAAELGMAGRFNILYAGNLGAAQSLGNVLDAAGMLHDLPNVQFVFVGEGVEEHGLRLRVAREKLKNVQFLGRTSPERVAAMSAIADVLLVHLRRDPLFELTIPSKTISSLACGRPVLAVCSGDAARVVVDARAGLVCEPERPRDLAESVRRLYKMPAARREEFGRNGRSYFLTNFTRDKLADKYEMLLNDVARTSGACHSSRCTRDSESV